jgi:hypothetical protein
MILLNYCLFIFSVTKMDKTSFTAILAYSDPESSELGLSPGSTNFWLCDIRLVNFLTYQVNIPLTLQEI